MKVESLDPHFDECREKINQTTSIDQRLTLAIEFMKEALSAGHKARFRDFWRMKKICLDLFKAELHRAKRTIYWTEYTTLLSQAHALQRIIEEQTGFQRQQISLAIDSLEEGKEGEIGLNSKEVDPFAKIDSTSQLFKLYKN